MYSLHIDTFAYSIHIETVSCIQYTSSQFFFWAKWNLCTRLHLRHKSNDWHLLLADTTLFSNLMSITTRSLKKIIFSIFQQGFADILVILSMVQLCHRTDLTRKVIELRTDATLVTVCMEMLKWNAGTTDGQGCPCAEVKLGLLKPQC